jgi:N-acetylglucosamine kinase-like BadF-type ATPase
VAALARVVIDTAGDGDAAAQAVVNHAARQLVELVTGLADRTGVRRVALTGGLLQAGALLEAVQRALRSAGLDVLEAEVDPIEGAWGL